LLTLGFTLLGTEQVSTKLVIIPIFSTMEIIENNGQIIELTKYL
jgi:hypothetical protein